ncbi:hypothetical protein XENTR_v10014130 [Xenopus tropicalis]|nr:hypothetical protein XENTR_v10014130 [Xenopus tropicalis]
MEREWRNDFEKDYLVNRSGTGFTQSSYKGTIILLCLQSDAFFVIKLLICGILCTSNKASVEEFSESNL